MCAHLQEEFALEQGSIKANHLKVLHMKMLWQMTHQYVSDWKKYTLYCTLFPFFSTLEIKL